MLKTNIFMAKIFLVLSFFLFSSSLKAQNAPLDTTQSVLSDSARELALLTYQKRLSTLDSLRTSDSLRRMNLEVELASLRTTDNVKKEELLRELQGLSDREVLRIQRKKTEIDSLRNFVKGSVVPGLVQDTLCIIYSRLGSFSAFERAAAISSRLIHFLRNGSFRQIV
jgi:hypothetical protein